MNDNGVLTCGSINVSVQYFLLLGYFLLTDLTLILTLNNTHYAILTLTAPHDANMIRKYGIEKSHIKH